MNFWLHLEKGAEANAIFPCGNTIPLSKINAMKIPLSATVQKWKTETVQK
jgi:hypothetical protein